MHREIMSENRNRASYLLLSPLWRSTLPVILPPPQAEIEYTRVVGQLRQAGKSGPCNGNGDVKRRNGLDKNPETDGM